MPFIGPDDAKLPSNVKKLTKSQRQKWVSTFNNTFNNCRDDKKGGGAGSEDNCEELAFRVANGSIKKEVGVVGNEEKKLITEEDKVYVVREDTKNTDVLVVDEKDERSQGEKFYEAPVVVAEVVERPRPFGGAQSFEEVEEWEQANEKRFEVNRTLFTARDIMENVMDDEDLEGKPNKLQSIVDGLRAKISGILNKSAKAIEPEREKQSTKTEEGVKFKASDYAVVPDREKPTTWKLRLAEGSSGNFTVAQVARAITAMQPGGFRGQKVELESGDKAQAVSRISAAIGKVDATDDQKDNLRRRLKRVKELPPVENKPPVTSAFMITKDKDGNMRWLGCPTNKWRDRDNPPQIIEEKAHLDFIDYLGKSKEYPVLLSWHTPGTRMGKADFADYSNGFLVMGGTIDKDKYAEAERLAVKCQSGEVGMSHGFVYAYSDKKKEIIGTYRAWEVSHLPTSRSANVWTSIDILNKEVKQMFNPDKRKYLVDLHGEETVASMEAKVADIEKDLLSAGIEFKDIVPHGEVDSEEMIKATAKAIVESDGFKSLVDSIGTLTETVKALKETDLPALALRLDEVDKRTQKTVDDVVSEAFTSKSQTFQASREGKEPSEEDKKKEEASQVKTIIEPHFAASVTGS